VSGIEHTDSDNQVSSEQEVGALARRAAANMRQIVGPKPYVYRRRQREAWVVACILLFSLPLFTTGVYGLGLGRTVMLHAMLALGFYFQFALSGQFSLATAAFYATGAYVGAFIVDPNATGFLQNGGFPVAFLAAVIIAGLLGAVVKLALSRSPLIQFGIATLSFAELMFLVYRNSTNFTNGNTGRFGLPPISLFGFEFNTPVRQYLLCTAFVLFGAFLLILFERSPAQRDQIFTRDMAAVAKTTGLRTGYLQVVAFAIGAAYMGGAGAIFAQTGTGFVHPTAFSTELSLDILVMVLIGGIGTPWGAVVGAIVLTIMPEWLRSIAKYKDIIYAGAILIVILVLPGGLVSLPRVLNAKYGGRFKKRKQQQQPVEAAS